MLETAAKDFFGSLDTIKALREALDNSSELETMPTLTAELAGMEFLGLIGSEQYGGSDASLLDLVVIATQAGRFLTADTLVGTSGRAVLLLQAAAEQSPHARDLLARTISGDIQVSVLEAGDLRFDGATVSGHLRPGLNALTADVVLTLTEFEDRPSVVAVDKRSLAVEPGRSFDPSRGIGRLLAADAPATILFSGPPAQAAWEDAFDAARVLLAAQDLGTTIEALSRARDYALTRQAFGRTIGSFQAIKHALVDVYVAQEQLRSLVWLAAWAHDFRPAEARLYSAAAAAYASETVEFAAVTLINVHGGIGYTWEHDAHLFWRRAMVDKSLLGTASVNRDEVATLLIEGRAGA